MSTFEEIKEIMEKHKNSVTGKIGIGYKNFKTGDEYYVNGDDRFPSASKFKVPVLIELFNQDNLGKISLKTMYTLKEEDIAPGSGVLSNLTPGLSMSIRDYAVLMMAVSDNTATDIIYNMLGRDNIAATIEKLGLKNTKADMNCKVLLLTPLGVPLDTGWDEIRRIFEERDYKKDYSWITDMSIPNDISSPRDMITMFSSIYHKEIITPEACDQMLHIMEKCEGIRRIPHFLPRRGPNAVKVIHKTGTLEYINCDSGIIISDDHTYCLSIFYNGFTGDPTDKTRAFDNDMICAQVSGDIYKALH
ncbi:MAG: class A beta-lactamase-related serine hydrolase [Treponema sp.]|nr:class A beta-lactamase-related serine hydrolase [Treponema sp.]